MGHRLGIVEIWSGEDRIAVHPLAQTPRSRFTLPGQWDGLALGTSIPLREALAVEVPVGQVEQRLLEVYELAA